MDSFIVQADKQLYTYIHRRKSVNIISGIIITHKRERVGMTIIRQINVGNFRGIRKLDWDINASMVCLVGPGDSTKTTILQSIDFALSPKWNTQFTDSDFFQGNTDEPIEIATTIGDIPKKLLDDKKYGLYIRGWNPTDKIHDEPEAGDESVLTVKLIVDNTLEPVWGIYTERSPELIRISAKDREMFGVCQLGSYVDNDLAWGRGSALSRFTGDEDTSNIQNILATAMRDARKAIADADLKELSAAAKRAEVEAKTLGVKTQNTLTPGIDSANLHASSGALALYDGNVPARYMGLGSRRLLTMAIQKGCSKNKGLLLIDEIEHGLEPYRIRHLIRNIRPTSDKQAQVFITTHSSVAIVEMKATEIFIVKAKNGNIIIENIGDSLQDIVRSFPEAFFAKKLIVCEGKTEQGFCIGLENFWVKNFSGPLSYSGALPIITSTKKGGGSEAASIASKFKDLDYIVSYFGDSDVPIDPTPQELEARGVKVFMWEGNVSIEQRLATDLPIEAVDKVVDLAVLFKNEVGILEDIREVMGTKKVGFPSTLADFKKGLEEARYREIVGRTSKRKSWFKMIEKGRQLGSLVSDYLPFIPDTNLCKTIVLLGVWCYA
jgi:putative ATP-dependent endonuclease of the OLD family